jgi:hypothetical protein
MSRVVINISELLNFYDEDDSARSHANAVKSVIGEELGLALVNEHFKSQGARSEICTRKCTTGKNKGPRLDGWLKEIKPSGTTMYQVEVKTWSRHSFSGKPLLRSASPREVEAFKVERWQRYWDGNRFRDKNLDKVLIRMHNPDAQKIEALACLWDAVHPRGHSSSFFTVPVMGRDFPRVNVFSMSSYLRGLNARTLPIELPDAFVTLNWLSRIVTTRPLALKAASNRI